MGFLKWYFGSNRKKNKRFKENGYFSDGECNVRGETRASHYKGSQRSKHPGLAFGTSVPWKEDSSRPRTSTSAKVIQMLGAESINEALEILQTMESSASTPRLENFSSDSKEEEEEEEEEEVDSLNVSVHEVTKHNSTVMKIATTPTIPCKAYLPGRPQVGHVVFDDIQTNNGNQAHSAPEHNQKWMANDHNANNAWQGFPNSVLRDVNDENCSRYSLRPCFVSKLPFEYSPGPSRKTSYENSPLGSPHRRSFHEAHPLPTPPASPNLLDHYGRSHLLAPKRTPLLNPILIPVACDRDFENRRPQRYAAKRLGMSPTLSPFVSPPPHCPQNWKRGRVLGKGSFGVVYEGMNREDGSFFAVKISDVEATTTEICQEVNVLSRLSHQNIVRYLGSSVVDNRLCIFLELVGMGSLRTILDKYKHFDESLIKIYTRQILNGLEYLHLTNTIHRDIKCANILVHPDGQVKLADFGLAKQMTLSLANSCKGTPQYMAPEIMKPSSEKRKYGLAVDIWSLGCTIIEMADGKVPWSDLGGYSFFFKVSEGKLPPVPDHLSLEAKDFISKCLKFNPEERATVSELLHHPFVATVSPTMPQHPIHMFVSRLHS